MKKIVSAKEIVEKEISEKGKFSENMRGAFLKSKWSDIVGKQLSVKSDPMYIKNGILYICVEGSGWLQQMNFYKKEITVKANEVLNGFYIKGVYFVNKKIPEKIKISDIDETEKINNLSIIPLENGEIYKIKEAISKIEDIELKKKIYRLMVKEKKKEKYLLENGYKKCGKCGILHKEKGNNCYLCENDKKIEIEQNIFRYLLNNYYASDEELKIFFPNMPQENINSIRGKISSRLFNKMVILFKEKKVDECFKVSEKYFAISTGIKNRDIILKKIELFFASFT